MKQRAVANYLYTEEYQYFLKKGGDKYRELIKKMNVDEFCENMFDAEIDAITDVMKTNAAGQYTDYLRGYHKKRRMQEADLVLKRAELQRLNAKLKCIENEIAQFRAIKLERIYKGEDKE